MSSERVAVITGASGWVGHGVAQRLADRGLSLVLAARRGVSLDRLSDECREAGVPVVTVRADVARDDDAALVAGRAIDAFGSIDVWINSAGVGVGGPFDRARALDGESIIRTNLVGTLHGSHQALIHFRRRRRGVLINLAAAPGRIPAPYYAACAASRFGIVGLGAALREELLDQGLSGVRVCTVVPSVLGSLGSFGSPESPESLESLESLESPESLASLGSPGTLRSGTAPARCPGSSNRGVHQIGTDAGVSPDANGWRPPEETNGRATEITGAPPGTARVVGLIVHLIDQPRDEAVADATVRSASGSRTEISNGRLLPKPVQGAYLDSTPLRAAPSLPGSSRRRAFVMAEGTTAPGETDGPPVPDSPKESQTPGRLAGVGAPVGEPGEGRRKGGA